MAFIAVFAVFAAASASGPLAQWATFALFFVPFSVLGYFMREAASGLRPAKLERRRSRERSDGLVIDV
jgi:hypothetical protein